MNTVTDRIRTFDDLDFHVFSDQAWSELSKVMRRTSSFIGPMGIRSREYNSTSMT
jgi:hypothetical protein